MSLVDELQSVSADKGGCAVCKLLAGHTLGALEKDALTQALSSKVGYRALAKILARNNHPVPEEHIRLHRKERHGQ